MNAVRYGYAQARVQARFGRRPALHEFRLLDASRSIAHLHEALRQGPLAAYVAGLGPAPDSDAFEARLRAAWRAACAEVARWYAPEWSGAFATFCARADLPSLELLRGGGAMPAWLRADPVLGEVARHDGEARTGAVRRVLGAALADAFADAAPLALGWQSTWRASWPAVGPRLARLLAEAAELQADGGAADERRLSARTARLERLFRRAAGSPAAAFAYLGLLAITLERIRGGRAALLVTESAAP